MFSKYDVYTTVQSMYCYPDTDVLINKLNLGDEDFYGFIRTQLHIFRFEKMWKKCMECAPFIHCSYNEMQYKNYVKYRKST